MNCDLVLCAFCGTLTEKVVTVLKSGKGEYESWGLESASALPPTSPPLHDQLRSHLGELIMAFILIAGIVTETDVITPCVIRAGIAQLV
jgi:hypothetical protein